MLITVVCGVFILLQYPEFLLVCVRFWCAGGKIHKIVFIQNDWFSVSFVKCVTLMNDSDSPAYWVTDLLDSMTTYTTYTNTTAVELFQYWLFNTRRSIIRGMYGPVFISARIAYIMHIGYCTLSCLRELSLDDLHRSIHISTYTSLSFLWLFCSPKVLCM